MGGSPLAEFRLRAGFILFPVACAGVQHAARLLQLSLSDEMAPWRLGIAYDKPIPRRIIEQAGIARGAFARTKLGGNPQYGEFALGPTSDRDFRDFIRRVHGREARAETPHPELRRLLRKIVRPGLSPHLQSIRWLLWRDFGHLLDRRWATDHPFTFHWGVERTRPRYELS